MIAALVLSLAFAQAAAQSPDADALRALVLQHFESLARDEHSEIRADVRRIEIDGDTARVRALVDRTTSAPGQGGNPVTRRSATLLLETWRREGDTWTLLDEKSLADALADTLIAAPRDRWGSLLASEDLAFVLGPLRMAISTRGSAAASRQRYADALVPFAILREIGRIANVARVQLEALQNLGNANYFLRRYQDAADAYADEVALAREARDPDYEAAALDGVGMVAYSRGEYAAALDGYRAALEIAERSADGAAAGRALVSVGNVQYLQGDYDLAAGSYRRALALLAEAHDDQTLAMAWRGAARVYTAQGDLASALVSQTRALDGARARAAQSEIANDQETIGELHFKLGNTAEARAAFDEARRIFDSLRDADGAGRLLGDIGLTEVVAERFDAAVAAYTGSREQFQRAKDAAGIGHAWVGLGFSEAGRGHFPDAIDAYKIAIGLFDAGNRREDAGRAWLGLSLAHYASADYASALADARRVSAIAADIGNDDLAWRAHVRAGDALRRSGQLDAAREEFEAAIAGIGPIAAFAATSADARTMLEDSGSAWAGLAFTLAEQGDPAGALLAAEQRRSHMLRVMLAPLERDITRGMTPEEAESERARLRSVVSLAAQKRAERAAPRPDATRLARIDAQLASALEAREREERALYSRRPDLQLWRGLRPVVSIDQLAAALSPDLLAVEYLTADDEVLVLTATRERRGTDDGLTTTAVTAAVVPWQRHEFALTLARALDPATSAPDSTAPLEAAADALLPPILSSLTGKHHVVVVPDDVLWGVPFEALLFGSHVADSALDLSYASSLYTLALRRHMRDADVSAAFVVAPTIASDTETELTVASPGWTPANDGAARREVDDEARAYADRARVMSGAAATQAAVVESLDREAVVQIAARIQLSAASPFFSCALLSPSAGEPSDDGRWELREWFDGRARGGALLLPDTGGAGVGGFGRAMLALDWASAAAGTSAVVVSRPSAAALDVTPVLRAFHRAVAAGVPFELAYGAAVSGARQQAHGALRAWTGLVVLGRLR